MKHSRVLFAITALFGAGLCVAAIRSVLPGAEGLAPEISPTAGQPAIAGAAASRSTELAKMTQLRRRVRAQEKRPADDLAGVESQASDAVRDPRSDPAAREEQKHKHREYMAGVDAAFREETTDPHWASAMTSVVHAALVADPDLGPLARGVECRSHTCRLEVSDDSSGKLSKLLPMFAQRVGQELPSIVADWITNPGGGATVVLYMSVRDEAQVIVR